MDNIFGRDRHKVDVTAGAGLTISAHIIVKGGRIVDVNVLYHSLIELASVWSTWSEMATQPRESTTS
jgi:hypothetical protein